MASAFKILKDMAPLYTEKRFLKQKAFVKFIKRMVLVCPIEKKVVGRVSGKEERAKPSRGHAGLAPFGSQALQDAATCLTK